MRIFKKLVDLVIWSLKGDDWVGTKREFVRCKAMSGVGGKADLLVERPDLEPVPEICTGR